MTRTRRRDDDGARGEERRAANATTTDARWERNATRRSARASDGDDDARGTAKERDGGDADDLAKTRGGGAKAEGLTSARRAMKQDAHATILDLDADTAFFAVFDGHGGKEVAMYAAKRLHETLKTTESYVAGDVARGLEESFLALDRKMLAKEAAGELKAFRAGGEKDDSSGFGGLLGDGASAEEQKNRRAEINAKLRAALIEQVKESNPDIDENDIKFDFELEDGDFNEIASSSGGDGADDASHENWTGPQAGATSVVVCVRGDKVYCANAGDSRAVFSRKGGEAVEMSEDHKPMNDGERKRIINAGGFVSEGRVNGSLALSRALGDFEYKMNKELDEKQQAVTAFPEIREFQLQEGDEFMILACDGIWDVMSSQECVNFVRERLVAKLKSGESDLKLSQICEELCDRCLAPDTRGSGLGCDNMSVVVVLLKKFCSIA